MAFVVPAIASAIGSIGSAAVAGAGALGTAAATGIGAIGSSASLGTLLQGGVSALSMLQSFGGAETTEASAGLVEAEGGLREALTGLEGARYGVEAGVMDLDAELTMLDAERTALALRRDLGKQIGAQRVAFAASGVDPTSGTAALLSDELRKNVNKDIATVRSDAGVARKTKRIAADMTRSGATAAKIQGAMESLATQGRLAQIATQANSQRMDGVMTGVSFLGDFLKRGI